MARKVVEITGRAMFTMFVAFVILCLLVVFADPIGQVTVFGWRLSLEAIEWVVAHIQ